MSYFKKLWITSCYSVIIPKNKNINIIGKLPYLKTPKNGKILLHGNITLNSDMRNSNTSLAYPCKLATGYDGKIEIGENTILNGSCIIAYKSIKIGKNCQIASSTMIADTDFHPISPRLRKDQVERKSFSFDSVAKEEIVLGDNVWVGWNSTILKGVRIGDNSIVGANSLVTRGNYPANVIIAGNPAKIIKELS